MRTSQTSFGSKVKMSNVLVCTSRFFVILFLFIPRHSVLLLLLLHSSPLPIHSPQLLSIQLHSSLLPSLSLSLSHLPHSLHVRSPLILSLLRSPISSLSAPLSLSTFFLPSLLPLLLLSLLALPDALLAMRLSIASVTPVSNTVPNLKPAARVSLEG